MLKAYVCICLYVPVVYMHLENRGSCWVSSSIGMVKENDPYKEWYLLRGAAL